jgi:hypothetical protein
MEYCTQISNCVAKSAKQALWKRARFNIEFKNTWCVLKIPYIFMVKVNVKVEKDTP